MWSLLDKAAENISRKVVRGHLSKHYPKSYQYSKEETKIRFSDFLKFFLIIFAVLKIR